MSVSGTYPENRVVAAPIAVNMIFPLQRIAENQTAQTLVFHGERTTWISPVSLKELLELKAKYPQATLVVGNTSVGM